MSRIGNNPIQVPKGVQIEFNGSLVNVKGPKGQLEMDTRDHVEVKQDEGALQVRRRSDNRQDRAFHGLYQRLLSNMVVGVSDGFARTLQLVGVGYRAQMKGKTLVMGLGYSHDVEFETPDGLTITTPEPTQIVIAGADKQQVGQVAANIRGFRPPEPYKGKGVRYMGEQVRRKVGKSGAK